MRCSVYFRVSNYLPYIVFSYVTLFIIDVMTVLQSMTRLLEYRFRVSNRTGVWG